MLPFTALWALVALAQQLSSGNDGGGRCCRRRLAVAGSSTAERARADARVALQRRDGDRWRTMKPLFVLDARTMLDGQRCRRCRAKWVHPVQPGFAQVADDAGHRRGSCRPGSVRRAAARAQGSYRKLFWTVEIAMLQAKAQVVTMSRMPLCRAAAGCAQTISGADLQMIRRERRQRRWRGHKSRIRVLAEPDLLNTWPCVARRWRMQRPC